MKLPMRLTVLAFLALPILACSTGITQTPAETPEPATAAAPPHMREFWRGVLPRALGLLPRA